MVPCGQNSIHPFCPVTHECVFDPTNPETSVCCPRESLDVCHFPKDPGPCRAAFTRWYYNKTLGHCAEFIYGGCDGNVNNFHSEALCESLCRGAFSKEFGFCTVEPHLGSSIAVWKITLRSLTKPLFLLFFFTSPWAIGRCMLLSLNFLPTAVRSLYDGDSIQAPWGRVSLSAGHSDLHESKAWKRSPTKLKRECEESAIKAKGTRPAF